MKEKENSYIKEAPIIIDYLIGKKASDVEIKKYQDAMQLLNITLTTREDKIWKFMLNNKWAFGSIDGALAIRNPQSGIRRKIFTMLAILEASTNHTTLFLPKKFSLFYLLRVGFSSLGAVVKMIVGNILLLLI